MASVRPKVALNVRVTAYQAISNLITLVVTQMTADVFGIFTTPAPALAALTAAQTTLDAAIAQWGPEGNRGSHADLLNLRNEARNAYNLLLSESDYVQNKAQIAAGNDYVLLANYIASSGFSVKNPPSPQGLLGQPQNLRRVFEDSMTLYNVKLAWNKPAGLLSPGNVKSYVVKRNTVNNFLSATAIATTTKTNYVDTTPPPGSPVFYWIQAQNTNGAGAQSMVLATQIPA